MKSTYTARIRGMRLAMRAQGYNYDALENCTGVNRTKLRDFAVGDRKNLPASDLKRIAGLLDVSVAFLSGWHDKKEQKEYRKSLEKKPQPALTKQQEEEVVLYLERHSDGIRRLCVGWYQSFAKMDRNFSGIYDVEDLMQEASMAVYKAYTAYDSARYTTPVNVFLDKCVQNALKEMNRKFRAKRREGGLSLVHADFERDISDAEMETFASAVRRHTDGSSWTEQQVEAKVMLESLMAWAKENLTERQFSIIDCLKQGMTQTEISRKLGCSQSYISSELAKIRVKLMEQFKKM